jgi:iron-sulfur cluster assembly protein
MFEITDSAAKQFQAAAKTIDDDSLSLRVTARKSEKSGMVYNMGFDKPKNDDISRLINGIEVLIDPESSENVEKMIIDFRNFEGQEQFVFVNPNDSKDSCETSPSGCDPDGNPSCRSCMEDG